MAESELIKLPRLLQLNLQPFYHPTDTLLSSLKRC